MLNIERGRLPVNAKEGDVLFIEGDAISIDIAETAKRKRAAQKLMENVWRESDKS